MASGAGDLARTLTDKAEDTLSDAADKITEMVPGAMKETAEDVADKALDKATELMGKAADKLQGK